jgi:pimeloyl-ACP methyl ester carboxylesterase
VDDLCALLPQFGLEAAHLVGLSLGGGVVIDFALAHPEKVLSLTLADAALGGFPWTKDWSLPGRTARSRGIEAAREAWLADELFAPAMEQPAVAACLRQMVADYSGWHWVHRSPERGPTAPANDRLDRVQAPTLVVVGERDVADFQRIADRLAYHIPGARRVELAGAGHMSSMESPDAFNAALLDFLPRLP